MAAKKPPKPRRNSSKQPPKPAGHKPDRSAPFGRDENGVPIAPHGLTPAGKVRRRPLRGPEPGVEAKRKPGHPEAILSLPDEAFAMAAIGCSNAEIADIYKISRPAFEDGLVRNPEIAAKLHEARAKGTRSVTKALWNRATGQEWRDKQGNFLPPDIAAIKFWLCNRARDHWKSEAKLEVQHSGEINGRPASAVLTPDMISDDELLSAVSEIAQAIARRKSQQQEEDHTLQ